MNIFGQAELREYLKRIVAALRKEIRDEDQDQLLGMDELEYVTYLEEKHSVEHVDIDWSGVSVSDDEALINSGVHPRGFDVRPGKSYPRHVVTYHIPYSGNERLLSLRPSTHRAFGSPNLHVSGGEITFEIINWYDKPEAIKSKANEIIAKLLPTYEAVRSEIDEFNSGLRSIALQDVRARKQQLSKRAGILESLELPIKKRDEAPTAFRVPVAKRRPVFKPTAQKPSDPPEYTLDEETYSEILRICRETGIEMERHPAIYAGKDEETLRDHLLMVLAPNFESATGETFNRSGKTDILIRHEGKNAFVAECKFWTGEKGYLETIDQLLGYLTWRDSKTAVILFIKNKNLQPVLDQIEPCARKHLCFVGQSMANVDDGRFSFQFHLPNDESRGVTTAVLCFHFPS